MANESTQIKPLWMDGNGRLMCGELRCAGQSAVSSGMRHDLNGAELMPIHLDEVQYFESNGMVAKCESCGALAQTIMLQ